MAVDIIARGLGAQASQKVKEFETEIENLKDGMTYQGTVDYYKDLPVNAEEGDTYIVRYKGDSGSESDNTSYVWGKYEGAFQWIAFGGGSYNLPKASVSELGGVRIGTGLTINNDGVLSTDGTLYKIQGSFSFVDKNNHLDFSTYEATYGELEPGMVFNVSVPFITDARFKEGAGVQQPKDTNIVILNTTIAVPEEYDIDIIGTVIDISTLATKTELDKKQDNLVAGEGIAIATDGKTISVTDTGVSYEEVN